MLPDLIGNLSKKRLIIVIMKISLLTLLISIASFSLHSAQILSLKGDVQLIRDQKVSTLKEADRLKEKDIIKTLEKSFVKISVASSIITIAPGSYYQIVEQSDDQKSLPIGQLIYGHIRAKFNKLENSQKLRSLVSPTASMGVRGTEVLFHVARDLSEYQQRSVGKFHPIPDLNELAQIMKTQNVFTQICCIEGEIIVKTKAQKSSTLAAGGVINFTATGETLKTYQYSPQVILQTAEQFGLSF